MMIPRLDGRAVVGKAYEEACTVADMADGPKKEKAKKAWAKKHKFSRFPRVLFRGNPDARDRCEKRGEPASDVFDHPGRYLIEPLA